MPLRRDFLKAGASVLGAYAAPPQLEKGELAPYSEASGAILTVNFGDLRSII